MNVVSLGCPKNDADTEVMLGILASHGYEFVSEPEDADILLINTCAFIQPAVEESLEFLNEATEQKRRNPHVKIAVTGCLPQRWHECDNAIPPDIDCVLGSGEYHRIAEALKAVPDGRTIVRIGEPRYMPPSSVPRIRISPPHYAYIKIADGCDNRCSYCLIPSLRGRYRSRSMRAIVSEARAAADAGAREIILVGQDTTRFGKDRNGSGNLATVLHNLSRIDGIEWLRILYTYPTHFSNHLIETIRDLPKVVHYLDIPLQHSHDDILARMNRRGTNADITRLINRLRETIHGITIRTTFMVGFPGETEKHFEHLLDFMERMCFDHVGIFAYSAEQGTKAALFPEQVPEPVKQERRDAAMRLQNAISLASNKRLVGRRFRVLIDSASSERKRFALGRTYRDAPEIDGRTFVQGNDLLPGTMVDVEITGAEAYDLIGKRV